MKKDSELSLAEKGLKALTAAVGKVVEEHRRQGRPLAMWRDGKAVWVSADELGKLRERPIPYRTKPPRTKS
jgi:hypothetical protein